jgi:hypothetical protein
MRKPLQAEIKNPPLPRRETYVIQRYEPDALNGAGDWWEVRAWQGGVQGYPSNREEAITAAKYLVSSKYIRQEGAPATAAQLCYGFKHRVVKETVSYEVEWESGKGESDD